MKVMGKDEVRDEEEMELMKIKWLLISLSGFVAR